MIVSYIIKFRNNDIDLYSADLPYIPTIGQEVKFSEALLEKIGSIEIEQNPIWIHGIVRSDKVFVVDRVAVTHYIDNISICKVFLK